MEQDPISNGTPKSEVEIDENLIRQLLRDQHPDLAGLPLEYVDDGWDNSMYRLGDELAVRLPRRELGAPLIVNEQKWLPVLAKLLPIPIPVPMRIGKPACGYPWRWSIVPWLVGVSANQQEPHPSQGLTAWTIFACASHSSAPGRPGQCNARNTVIAAGVRRCRSYETTRRQD